MEPGQGIVAHTEERRDQTSNLVDPNSLTSDHCYGQPRSKRIGNRCSDEDVECENTYQNTVCFCAADQLSSLPFVSIVDMPKERRDLL